MAVWQDSEIAFVIGYAVALADHFAGIYLRIVGVHYS